MQRKHPDGDEWGDVHGRRNRAVKDMKQCYKAIEERCGEQVPFAQFERLAADMPLLVAPAAFTWAIFERALLRHVPALSCGA